MVSGWLHQLCDAMIFNHDPPTCVECGDCGGISRCGMGCSALVANIIGGYPVCTTLGYSSSTFFELIDKTDPLKGITAKLFNRGSKSNCSLAVSIVCDTNGVQGPQTLELVGTCDYATKIHHPSGCALIISSHGNGMGWFGTMLILILFFLGVYLRYENPEDDEETSTGHSPSTMTTHDMRECFDRRGEEVASSAGVTKRHKLLDGSYDAPELRDTATSAKAYTCSDLEDDAQSSCGNGLEQDSGAPDSPSGKKRLRKDKIRETISILQEIIPGGKGKDSMVVIDDAIHYLRSLKMKAKSLGLDSL